MAMTTVNSGPQITETRIGTLEFTHNFANGYPLTDMQQV